MKQDQWIDLNIHQQENKKSASERGNEILLIRQILQSLVCIIGQTLELLLVLYFFFLILIKLSL